MIISFNGIHPRIDPTVFIAETAVVIGDVHIGSESSLWYNVVVRGDVNFIRIGSRTNIQDLSILHVTGQQSADDPGQPLIIGDDITIGHGVTLHGCTIENNAFIGMKSLIMDRAIIGSGAMVGAGSLVTRGTVIPPRSLWLGSPAKFVRELNQAESAVASATSASYLRLARQYLRDVSQ